MARLFVTYEEQVAEIDLSFRDFPGWLRLEHLLKTAFNLYGRNSLNQEDRIYLRFSGRAIGRSTIFAARELAHAVGAAPIHKGARVLACEMVIRHSSEGPPPPRIPPVPPYAGAVPPKRQQEEAAAAMVDLLVGSAPSYHPLCLPRHPSPTLEQLCNLAATELGLGEADRPFAVSLRQGDRLIRLKDETAWRRIGWPAAIEPYKEGKKPGVSEVTTFEVVGASAPLPVYTPSPVAAHGAADV
ncbi:hypothetical protein JCM6882_005532 [Rhodosporidiobolus microsporus]